MFVAWRFYKPNTAPSGLCQIETQEYLGAASSKSKYQIISLFFFPIENSFFGRSKQIERNKIKLPFFLMKKKLSGI